MNIDKQNRHIPGTQEYNNYKEKLKKRGYQQSYITVEPEELDNLVRSHLNPKKILRQSQYIDVGTVVGHYRTKGIDIQTTRLKVMQSKTGYHAVPMKPKEMLERENKRKN
nr:polymorphic toxin type 50 domain-containing protein [Limosilactobacillus coleohominis]